MSVEVGRQASSMFGSTQKHRLLYFDFEHAPDTCSSTRRRSDGLTVGYHFVTEVLETDLADLHRRRARGQPPAQIHPQPTASWVEPKTGTIVDGPRGTSPSTSGSPTAAARLPQAVCDFGANVARGRRSSGAHDRQAQAERLRSTCPSSGFGQTVLPLILGIAGLCPSLPRELCCSSAAVRPTTSPRPRPVSFPICHHCRSGAAGHRHGRTHLAPPATASPP